MINARFVDQFDVAKDRSPVSLDQARELLKSTPLLHLSNQDANECIPQLTFSNENHDFLCFSNMDHKWQAILSASANKKRRWIFFETKDELFEDLDELEAAEVDELMQILFSSKGDQAFARLRDWCTKHIQSTV